MQQFLYFLPLPQGHGSFLPGLAAPRSVAGRRSRGSETTARSVGPANAEMNKLLDAVKSPADLAKLPFYARAQLAAAVVRRAAT